MSHRCLGTAVLALVGLLAFPSRGHANIIDWILVDEWSPDGELCHTSLRTRLRRQQR